MRATLPTGWMECARAIRRGVAVAASLGVAATGWAENVLPPIPEVPAPRAVGSVRMADSRTADEVKLGLEIAAGPFGPTWESIEANYPGTPDWLRESKFGIWVHFGPQSAGESGDWYARRMYNPATPAYKNHVKRYGHPSEVGYKEVLRDWNPSKLDPAALTKLYHESGARYLIIQGVHHDQFDSWNSKHQPWNSVNLGPKRDLMGEWAKACRAQGMRFGITFHHEYSWWWWQTAFGADKDGPKAGVPYDGRLTLADGVGTWWEGMDPRLLYGIDLREYETVDAAAHSDWNPPKAGLFQDHMPYAKWYATWWALRMMDAVDQYGPDFIYTDGTSSQPFSGNGTGAGIKCDGMQTVMAHFYNRTLAQRGKVDTFSIVKFRPRTNGTVNTEEFGVPREIKTEQSWIAEAPVGDWFYGPNFTYDSRAIINYIVEASARDGNSAVCVSLLPDGSLDEGSLRMLQEVGAWMAANGEAIYGSKAWVMPGEGQNDASGGLKMIPGGKLGGKQAEPGFSTKDFRFTVGKDGALYVFCMIAPEPGETLSVTSLGAAANRLGAPITSVAMLGTDDHIAWEQKAEALEIVSPQVKAARGPVCFRVHWE
jgi:alpha-L-fucosidase